MKKSISTTILTLCLLFCFVGCASTKQPKPKNPNFLGDFEPFSLGEAMCLSTENFGGLKPAQLSIYFAPRTNTIFVHTKVNFNKIEFVITREAAQKIESSVEQYMNDYNQKAFTDRKPTAKNQYDSSKSHISWGVLGYSRSVDTPINFNYEIKDSKPYYRIKFEQTDYVDEDHVASPNIAFYFSPNQLETLFELCDYDEILKRVDELHRATYDFDYNADSTGTTDNSTISYDF